MPARDFASLYETCSRMVYWTAFGIVKSDADAMDISQTAFLRALKHQKTLDKMDDAHVKAWMYRVTKNLALDVKRREKRVTPVDEFYEVETQDEEDMPEKSMLNAEKKRALKEAIEALPEIYRETVTLHYFAEMNYAQMAKIFAVSEGTIKSRMSRAKTKLAVVLKEEGE